MPRVPPRPATQHPLDTRNDAISHENCSKIICSLHSFLKWLVLTQVGQSNMLVPCNPVNVDKVIDLPYKATMLHGVYENVNQSIGANSDWRSVESINPCRKIFREFS